MDKSLDQTHLLSDSQFHNPVLKISNQENAEKVHLAVQDFVLKNSKLTKVASVFREEINLGLASNPSRKSLFYMANTFVTQFPDGSEEGDFLAIDLGGTNLRIVWTKLTPGKAIKVEEKAYKIDSSVRQNNAEELFDYLADCVQDLIGSYEELRQYKKENKPLKLGFTFSFGFDQLALDVGIVKQFSFSTDIADAIGKDAVLMLRNSLKKKKEEILVDVVAILNDSTATMMYGRYLDSHAYISLLLSTGYNIAYIEKIQNIEKLKNTRSKLFSPGSTHLVINTESCLLGDDHGIDFAKTKYDLEVDVESSFEGSYGFGKMVGGNFMGELIRKCLMEIITSGGMLNGKITEQLKTTGSIGAPDVSKVEAQDGQDEFGGKDGKIDEAKALLMRLGYSSFEVTIDDCLILRHVCARVSVRNAIIVATVASVVAERIDQPVVKIACDGSLYKYHPKLHKLMSDFMNELVKLNENNVNKKVMFFEASGGSGIGAALTAAVADKMK